MVLTRQVLLEDYWNERIECQDMVSCHGLKRCPSSLTSLTMSLTGLSTIGGNQGGWSDGEGCMETEGLSVPLEADCIKSCV